MKLIKLFILFWAYFIIGAWALSALGYFSVLGFRILIAIFLVCIGVYIIKSKFLSQSKVCILKAKAIYLTCKKDFYDYLAFLVTIFWFVYFAYCLYRIVLLPPENWDSMTYHLTKIANANQTGTLWHDSTIPVSRVNVSPSNSEIFNMVFFSILGKDLIVEIPQLMGAFFTVIGLVFIVVRHFKVDWQKAVIASLSLLTIPLFISQSYTTQNDLLFVAVSIISMLFTLEYYNYKSFSNLLFCIISVSILAGLKLSGLIVAFPCCLMVLLRYMDSFKTNWKNTSKLIKDVILALVIFLTLALLNYIIAKIYYGKFTYLPNDYKAIWGIDTFLENLRHFHSWIYVTGGEVISHDTGSIGMLAKVMIPLFLVGFILDFLNSERRKGGRMIIFFAPIFFTLIFLFSHTPDPWDLRLVLLLPIICVYFGTVFFINLKNKFIGGFVFCYIVMFVFNTVTVFYNADKPKLIISLDKYQSGYGFSTIGDVFAYRPDISIFEKDNLSSADILFLGSEDSWVYPYYRSDWRNKIVFTDEDNLPQMIQNQTYKYVLLERSKIDLVINYVPSHYVVLAEDNFFRIYKFY